MLTAGELVDLDIEKPAAGGRMIARSEGRVMLVQGAIPGERVRARVERVERNLAFASAVEVLNPSSQRVPTGGDPLCGGCLYAHIAYPRQRTIKSEVVVDAFARIGRIELDRPVTVVASPPRGYRMRARLHVQDRRAGFYREGTHELCDAAQTGQLLDGTVAAIEQAVAALASARVEAASLEVAENIDGSERAIHIELRAGATVRAETLRAVLGPSVVGCSAQAAGGTACIVGTPTVADTLALLTGGRATGELRRHARSFFQANRYLLPTLVNAVIDRIAPEGAVLDLYAGVGLFSVALAGCGHAGITAVEGDQTSGADLQRNAAPYARSLRAFVAPVEAFLKRVDRVPSTIVVDPPRTGVSKPALQAILGVGARRLIYVSCDPPTMARDARRIIDEGYRLRTLEAFDLFPNTPHVETLGIFDLE